MSEDGDLLAQRCDTEQDGKTALKIALQSGASLASLDRSSFQRTTTILPLGMDGVSLAAQSRAAGMRCFVSATQVGGSIVTCGTNENAVPVTGGKFLAAPGSLMQVAQLDIAVAMYAWFLGRIDGINPEDLMNATSYVTTFPMADALKKLAVGPTDGPVPPGVAGRSVKVQVSGKFADVARNLFVLKVAAESESARSTELTYSKVGADFVLTSWK